MGERNADRASSFLFGTAMELITRIREVHSSNLTNSHVLSAALFIAVPRTIPHYATSVYRTTTLKNCTGFESRLENLKFLAVFPQYVRWNIHPQVCCFFVRISAIIFFLVSLIVLGSDITLKYTMNSNILIHMKCVAGNLCQSSDYMYKKA